MVLKILYGEHIKNMGTITVWDNGLYPVSCILNKCCLDRSQTGSIVETTKQEAEVVHREFWEEERVSL